MHGMKRSATTTMTKLTTEMVRTEAPVAVGAQACVQATAMLRHD